MYRYALQIEYDGSFYKGWQRQEEGVPSVQEFLETHLEILTKEKVTLHGSGRTDTGVHATAQVAHFDLKTPIAPYKIQRGLSFFGREKGISIIDISDVNHLFHSRFSARERQYHYIICNRFAPPVLRAGKCTHIITPLDFEKMAKACKKFEGTHDFTSFRDQACQGKTPVKTLDEFSLTKRGDFIVAKIRARSFLHHQVRIMMGTLIQIGHGKMKEESIDALFELKDRSKSGPTAPPHGLFLTGILFDQEVFKEPYREIF
jgi:tRNA pseudouridine38-40 synthase